MNTPAKPEKPKREQPPRRTGKAPEGAEMHERVTKRFPRIMARLSE
jgi:hypothetical protein